MTKKYLYQVVYYQAVTAYNKAYSVIRVLNNISYLVYCCF